MKKQLIIDEIDQSLLNKKYIIVKPNRTSTNLVNEIKNLSNNNFSFMSVKNKIINTLKLYLEYWIKVYFDILN